MIQFIAQKFSLLRNYKYKRAIKFFWQRRIRGFDDSETWSMDNSLSKLILPRLKRFKKVKIGSPSSLSKEEWDQIIDRMIYSFEWLAAGKQFESENEIEIKKVNEGLHFFAKYYRDLWW